MGAGHARDSKACALTVAGMARSYGEGIAGMARSYGEGIAGMARSYGGGIAGIARSHGQATALVQEEKKDERNL